MQMRLRVTGKLLLTSLTCRTFFLFLALWVAGKAAAQQVPRLYENLPLANASSFTVLPASWTYADSLIIHPEKANALRTLPGTRYLVGKPGDALLPKLSGRNFKLYMSYVLSPGASGIITLPGGISVQISEGRNLPDHKLSGYTGIKPLQDAGKLAGLLQTLEIDFESNVPHLSGKARINELKINGVVVQQGQYFSFTPATPLSIRVSEGVMGISAIGYREFQDRKPVRLQNFTYKIYNDAWDARTTDLLGESGQSPILTYEVAEGRKSFHLVYEGTMIVDEPGDYDFTTIYTGALCQLSIDDNVVLDTEHSNSQEIHHTNVRLDEGSYKFRLWYSRFPWASPALGLRVGKSGIRPYDLHATSSLPVPPAKPFIAVSPDINRAEMIRSFIQLPFETHKRTHCISVGAPSGRNYTMDLNRGALLQVWKGNFANATEMWYDRGEKQLLTSAGQLEILSGRSSFAVLNDAGSPWTDSSAVNFLDYRTDGKGELTFRFGLGTSILRDSLSANTNGISRTIIPERNASARNYVLLAEGRKITQLEKGLYVVDGRYFIRTGKDTNPIIRKSGRLEELISPVVTPVSYSISW